MFIVDFKRLATATTWLKRFDIQYGWQSLNTTYRIANYVFWVRYVHANMISFIWKMKHDKEKEALSCTILQIELVSVNHCVRASLGLPLKQQTCMVKAVSHADVVAACTSPCWNHLNTKKMRQSLDGASRTGRHTRPVIHGAATLLQTHGSL